MLGAMTGGRYEGDETGVSIPVSKVVGITFFSGIGILECINFR